MPMDQDKDINNQVITCHAWRQEQNWGTYEPTGTGLGLVRTMQNFVCVAKKSVNRKPFLVSSNCALPCTVALVPNFCSRSKLENFRFFTEIICWAPWISHAESIGLPTILFFLEHSHEWFLFTYQNFLNCHQTSKMLSRTFWSQPKSLDCFVRQQNPLFLGLPWWLSFIGACYFAEITN